MKKAQTTIIVIIILLVLILLSNVYAGTPKITSCVDEIEKEPAISVQGHLGVKNIGSQAGQFDLKISCNKEEVGATGYSGFFQAGEEQIVDILISGSNPNKDNPLVAICTYTLTDRKEQKSDSCSSSVIIKGYGVIDNKNIEQLIPSTDKTDNSNSYISYLIIGIAIIIGFIILALVLRSRR